MKSQITVREFAFRHKMLPQAVYQKIWAGKLSATREDGRWFIDDPDVSNEQKTSRESEQ